MPQELQVVDSKRIKLIATAIVLVALAVLFTRYNPSESSFFPKCPFKQVTGLKCPGCGSQRAVHSLLNFDFVTASKMNLMLVISIPYLVLGFYFQSKKKLTESQLHWRKKLFGQKAIMIILFLVIGFWVLRNIMLYFYQVDF